MPVEKGDVRMDIQEAIQHCLGVAARATEQGKCPECAADHEQLAEWLTVLKQIAEIFNCDPNDPAQLKQLCDKLRGWQRAEQDGRLVMLPGGNNDAVLAAAFLGEKPVVMHGGGDTDDLIALTHVLVSYAAETLGAGYTDFCWRLGEMPPTTDFKPAKEAEAAVERKEEN